MVTLGHATTAKLVISDPYELSQELDVELLSTHTFVDGADRERALVQLRQPMVWHGSSYEFLALGARNSPGLLDELTLGQTVACTGFAIGAGEAYGDPPWGVDGWRGGLAVLATLRLKRV